MVPGRPGPLRIEVVDDAMARVLRQKTSAQRLAIAFSLWNFARDFLTAHLRSSHPGWTDQQVRCEVVRRLSHGIVGSVPEDRPDA